MGQVTNNIREIQVYALGGSAWGVPWFSCAPFPAKLETWLRLAGLPYRGVAVKSMRKAPKGKMPWIDDGDVVMGDSELIIAYLSKKHGVGLDGALSDEQRAQTRAWSALLEEHYHQVWEYFTFVGPGSDQVNAEVFAPIPAPLRPLFRAALKRGLRKQLHARGIGRHSNAEIMEMGLHDIDALSAFLGERLFFLGDEPTTLDACAFAFVGLTLWQPAFTPVHERVHEKANLVAYCERMRARVFR